MSEVPLQVLHDVSLRRSSSSGARRSRLAFMVDVASESLAHKKPHPPRTLQSGFAQGPMVALGGVAISYERVLSSSPVPSRLASMVDVASESPANTWLLRSMVWFRALALGLLYKEVLIRDS